MNERQTELAPAPRGGAGHNVFVSRSAYDPDCMNCKARATLAQHDHLHLGGGEPCTTIGIGGVAGQMVQCACGSFHH